MFLTIVFVKAYFPRTGYVVMMPILVSVHPVTIRVKDTHIQCTGRNGETVTIIDTVLSSALSAMAVYQPACSLSNVVMETLM